MLINNPLEMNDWKYGHFIETVVIIQVLMLLNLLLTINGILVPVLSSLIGFIYLTFIPGYLILRILRVHGIGSVRSVLYGVGLSISTLMFLGFVLNTFLPFFGMKNPISIIPIVLGYTVLVIFFIFLSFFRDRNFSCPNQIDISQLICPVFLFLCLVPFIAIFGSYFMNLYSNNLVSMFLIVIIALILLLVVYNRIPEKFYLFSVWIVSISLLYFSSLISPFVWGWDVQNEYYLGNLVLNFSYWNASLPDAYNAMLSIVMIGPVYSLVTSIDLDHVFKLVYPFIFSLMPLGLYKIFSSQTKNSKLAFIAVFLFISFNTFYIELVTISREMTAEFFMVLLIMLILERKYKSSVVFMLSIFSLSLVAAHYSLTYFFLISITGVTFIMALYNLSKFGLTRKIWGLGSANNLAVLMFVSLLTAVFAFVWYGNFADGLALKSITDVLGVVVLNMTQIVSSYLGRIGLGLSLGVYAVMVLIVLAVVGMVFYLILRVEKEFESSYQSKINILKDRFDCRILAIVSVVVFVILCFTTGPFKTWIVTILRYLNFTMVFFSIVGIFVILTQIKWNKFQLKFLAFSVVAFTMLVAGFVLPSFRAAFNITRIYEITFLILSPFCVYGGIMVVGSIAKLFRNHDMDSSIPLKLFTVFLMIFLLFNSGFVSVLSDTSIPMTLSNGNIASDYYPLFNVQEASSAQWLADNKVSSNIYADVYGRFIFNRYIFSSNKIAIDNGVTDFTSYNPNNSYIYQRKLDINNSYLTGFTGMNDRNRVYLNMSVIVNPKNTIFDDGDSRIYYS